MNLKEITTKQKLADAKQQRVEDFIRSGGEGNLRHSLFGRTDEVVTEEIVNEFYDSFAKLTNKTIDVDGGDLGDDASKQVCWYTIVLPDKVPVGSIDALLAKVDYDKNERRFTAYYRPKNGKWGQGKKTGRKAPKR